MGPRVHIQAHKRVLSCVLSSKQVKRGSIFTRSISEDTVTQNRGSGSVSFNLKVDPDSARVNTSINQGEHTSLCEHIRDSLFNSERKYSLGDSERRIRSI